MIKAQTNNLTKTLKKLGKHTDEAINFLSQMMMDEKADPKLRMQAAEFLISKGIELSKEQTKTSLALMVLQQRQNQSMKVVGETDSSPRVIADFTNVHRVEGVDYSELEEGNEYNMENISTITPVKDM